MSGSGFTNDIMHAENVDFSGNFPVTPQVTTNGQLLIGSTTLPNIRVGNLTATNAGSTVTFDYSSPNINLNLTDVNENTSLGKNAGNTGNLGGKTVALGELAGQNLAGTGVGALGSLNVLAGYSAGNSMTTAFENVAIGAFSLSDSTSCSVNTCVGYSSGSNLVSGQYNILIGADSGINYNNSEDGNIIIGTVGGTTGESNTIRIGAQGSGISQQNTCYIAGIKGVTVSNAQTVSVDSSTGQLGAQTGNPHVVLKSVNIDLKVAAATKLFTTTGDFIVTQVVAVGISVVGGGIAAINFGWTGAAYSDFILGFTQIASATGNFNGDSLGVFSIVDVPYLPASTDIYANVTANDAGATSNTQRFDFIGYYL